jgi:hypothetical protein
MFSAWNPNDEPAIKKIAEAWLKHAQQNGDSIDETMERISEAMTASIHEAMEESGRSLAGRLRDTEARMIANHGRLRRSFEHRLNWVWGETLNRLYAVIVSCEEMGAEFNDAHRPQAAEENDHKFEALVLIHARACLTATEIHALLRSGFPFGARARWRTLHELSVIAAIIGEGDDDLANRFLVHSDVEAYKDVLLHNEMCARTGYDPYPEDAVTELREIHDRALQQFGNGFKREWGWAATVTALDPPHFKLLEERAGLDHLRPAYRTASHLLHSGSSGANFVRRPFRGGDVLLTGATNHGLAEPAHGAAISLIQVTNQVIIRARPFDYGPLVVSMLQALMHMVEDVGEEGLKATQRVADLEEAFGQAEERGRIAMLVLVLNNRCLRALWRLSSLGRRRGFRLRTRRAGGSRSASQAPCSPAG